MKKKKKKKKLNGVVSSGKTTVSRRNYSLKINSSFLQKRSGKYASRGGREQSPYPWGGYYLRNKKGCLLANFKPGRGNYPEDGGFYTVRADAYWPNDYGLYNMSGNVAEWTQDIYYENAYSFTSDMNPYLRMDIPDNAVPKDET